MPYDTGSRQAVAAFVNIKRTRGLAAAKEFGRKHRGEISKEMKGNHNHHSKKKGYVARAKRSA